MISAIGGQRGRRTGAGVSPAWVTGQMGHVTEHVISQLCEWAVQEPVVLMSASGGRQHERNMTASPKMGQASGTDAARRVFSRTIAVGYQQQALRMGSWPMERLRLRTGLSWALVTLPKKLA